MLQFGKGLEMKQRKAKPQVFKVVQSQVKNGNIYDVKHKVFGAVSFVTFLINRGVSVQVLDESGADITATFRTLFNEAK